MSGLNETVPLPPPSLRLRLDREALAANWRALDALSGTARAGAAVKADAYGLGAARVVPVLRDAGCADWFVAHWQEVPPLLGLVPAERIAVLHGPITAADAAFACATGVRPVLNTPHQISRWIEAGGGPCDVMVDTGINRLGLDPTALSDLPLDKLDIVQCHSHLASADEDSPQNAAQLARFANVRAAVPAAAYALANSAGIGLGAAFHHDLTRPGLALYGGVPRADMAAHLRQVATPEAALVQVRDIPAGAAVGYNATFVAPVPMRVGVVSLGYADGVLRCWSGGVGRFWRGGAVLPVLGRVSMDMIVLDLAAAPDAREGDWVAMDYALPQAAAASGLSQYELLTLMGGRFARD